MPASENPPDSTVSLRDRQDPRRSVLTGGKVMAIAGAVVGVAVILLVAVAFAVAARGGDVSIRPGAAGPPAASGPIAIDLTEFTIEMSATRIAAGEVVFEVVNSGVAPHDFVIEGVEGARTPELNGGESYTLRVDLAPGRYTVVCEVPGHAATGMTGEFEVVDAQGVDAAPGHEGHGDAEEMTWEEHDALMRERTLAFPAETEGLGGIELEPEILADGTMLWELTASIIDWEVEPGRIVQAMAYNEMIPGPTLRGEVGDRVRIILHNELPESTAIHFHGLITPNSMDGVPDITQPPVAPGETFVYEFELVKPAVGMYHSHHHAQIQVPGGLAGTFLVGQMPVPDGVEVSQEISMHLNDASPLGYSLNGKSFPATAPVVATKGEHILVHYMNEGLQIHPMHLHGIPQLVVAKDGFPLPQPMWMDTVNVAPGERWTVLIEAEMPGVWAWHCHILTHADRKDGMFGMVTALIVEEPGG
jgi:manganese oxidase